VASTRLGSRILSFDSARWCLLSLVALAPVVTSRLIGAAPLTHDAYELPKAVVVRVLAFAALAAWAVATHRENRPIRYSWWFAPVGLYVAWTALSAALSPSPATSLLGAHGRLDGLATVVTYGVIAFVSVQVFTKGRDLVAFGRTVSVAAVLVSMLGALQVANLDPLFYFETSEFTAGRVFATFGNPVFLGGFMALALPLQVTVAIGEPKVAWRVAGWVGSALSLFVLVATATRSAWIAVAIEIVVLAILLARKRVGPGREGAVIMGAGVVAVALFVVSRLRSGDAVLNVVERFTSLFTGGDGSTDERWLVGQSALKAATSKWFTGYGPGRFEVAFRQFRSAEHAASFPAGAFSDAHSAPLQIAATTGVVAALSWLVAVIWPIVTSFKHVASREGGQQRIVLAGVWTASLGYALFLGVGISVVGATAPMWVALAALAGLSARSASRAPGRWFAAVGWTLVAASVAVAVWSAMLFAADNRFVHARSQVRGIEPGDPAVTTAAAIRLSPLDIRYRQELPSVLVGVDDATARATALEALGVEPDDVTTLMLLGEAESALGNKEEAVRVVRRALTLAPNDPLVAFQLEQLEK